MTPTPLKALAVACLFALASTPSDAAKSIISFHDDPHARSMPVYQPLPRSISPGPGRYEKRKAVKAKRAVSPRVARAAPVPMVEEARRYVGISAQILPHPQGCPTRAFCGCGAALEVFGKHVRDLWLARNWFAFPRSEPAPGMVAVRRHHVFVIREVRGPGVVLAYDANSGGRKTRLHIRSLAGYVVVNPRGSRRYASAL